MNRQHLPLLIIGAALLLVGCSRNPQTTTAPTTHEASVKPGINEPYHRVTDAQVWVERFEREGREVYDRRAAIVAAVEAPPNATLADIGAGTGLFTHLFARRLADGGRVLAVDIVPVFLSHIADDARQAGEANVETVLCKEDSVELPPESIDVAFICDTYHHFEYPHSTMRSLWRAMRPGGRLYVVDFERIVGTSSGWILNHVRAGREVVQAEIELSGFEFVENLSASVGLRQNYMLAFRKP